MDPNVMTILSGAAKTVIETMAMTPCEAGQPYRKPDHSIFGAVTGVIGLAGSNANGSLVLSFEKTVVLHLTSQMLGEHYAEVTPEIVDAVGEMTNMICGQAKQQLADQGYKIEMATPLVLVGKEVVLRDRTDRDVFVVRFKTTVGDFVIETNLARTD